MSLAFFIFLKKSSGWETLAVAMYGMRCAAMMATMSFFGLVLKCLTGVVVVQAP